MKMLIIENQNSDMYAELTEGNEGVRVRIFERNIRIWQGVMDAPFHVICDRVHETIWSANAKRVS